MRTLRLHRWTLACGAGLFALLPVSCASHTVPLSSTGVSFGMGAVHWSELEQSGHESRLRGLKFKVVRPDARPHAWAFQFTLFDDADADGEPSPREVLIVRQALGNRPGVTSFPELRWPGTAVRPSALIRFRDGGTLQEEMIRLE